MNLREIAAQNIYSKPYASAGLFHQSYFWYSIPIHQFDIKVAKQMRVGHESQ